MFRNQQSNNEVRLMKPKTMILMVVAVGCGLGASYMTSRLLAERNKGDSEPTVPVLVAKAKVPAAQAIKDEKLFEVKQFPQSVAPKRALGSFEEIKGQRLKIAMDEGKPITQDDLVNKEQASLDYQLPAGMRAVAIKVTSESLVGGFVLPNTRVDIVHTTRGADASAKMILQNMLVLAVDTIDKRDGNTTTIIGQTVTMAATPEEATRLSLASSNGELRLLLKSASDTGRTASVEVRAEDLKRPIGQGADGAYENSTSRQPAAALSLPELGADERGPARQQEEDQRPVKRLKPHVLVIRNGLTVDKTVFQPERDPDEVTTTNQDGDNNPDRKDEKKPEGKSKDTAAATKPGAPATTPAAPAAGGQPSAFGKSTRTGKIQ